MKFMKKAIINYFKILYALRMIEIDLQEVRVNINHVVVRTRNLEKTA